MRATTLYVRRIEDGPLEAVLTFASSIGATLVKDLTAAIASRGRSRTLVVDVRSARCVAIIDQYGHFAPVRLFEKVRDGAVQSACAVRTVSPPPVSAVAHVYTRRTGRRVQAMVRFDAASQASRFLAAASWVSRADQSGTLHVAAGKWRYVILVGDGYTDSEMLAAVQKIARRGDFKVTIVMPPPAAE